MRLPVLFLLAITLPSTALASCGSDHCPIDLGLAWQRSVLSFDLSQQYIDQNQPRAGTHDVAVGAIPSPEDEVRTVNRITMIHGLYQPGGRWSLSASLPYVSRYHEHIHNAEGLPPERQRWSFDGIGDAELLLTENLRTPVEGGTRVHVSGGVKAPTGRTQVPEFDGDEPEPPSRPGNGAWAAIAGAGVEWRIQTRMLGGPYGALPVRWSILGRANGRGTERYRVGSELQSNLSAAYPLTRSLEILFSTDWRMRAKDDVGETDAEPNNTGGTWVFASPGVRVTAGGKSSVYGIVQLPVYERINGINLTSRANVYVGISRAIL